MNQERRHTLFLGLPFPSPQLWVWDLIRAQHRQCHTFLKPRYQAGTPTPERGSHIPLT